MDSPSLPIEEIRGELLDALQAPSPRILLKAPTGSGKSTGVPPMMDDAGLGERGLIVVVQPRRMAALPAGAPRGPVARSGAGEGSGVCGAL